MLIGYNYFPKRCTGDKNFWYDLIKEVTDRGTRVIVISITMNPGHVDIVNENLTIVYVRRPFHQCGPFWDAVSEARHNFHNFTGDQTYQARIQECLGALHG